MEGFVLDRNKLPNLASQIRTAFSSMAWNTGSKLARRTADDAEHLRGRRLLLQRLAQFLRTHLHLLFQIGIGFLQPSGHVIELIGERLQLVAGLDRDALREIAAADPRSSGPQSLDRHHHPARQEYAGERRETECAKQNQSRALYRGNQRLISLIHRQFDEHRPAERRHRRKSRQHPPALDIGRGFDVVRRNTLLLSLCRLNLGKTRHVRVAQDQADVRVRDQAALSIHHISVAALADLDFRHHVPDQLEIDFRDAHAGVAARTGERQRHVRLGLAAEIDRTVINLVLHRFDEFRLLRQIETATDDVHRQSRHPQLLLAAGIDLRKLGDRRNLTQQTQRIEAALFDGPGGPEQLRRPAHLTFDFLDELADLGRRRLRLLMLDLDQCVSMFPIGNPYFKNSIGQQRHANHGNEQPGIFQEQAAADLPRHRGVGWSCLKRCRAIRHSITSSASSKNESRSDRPNALAVLRLTTSSNLFGDCAGKLPGDSPLRMRST